MVCIRASNINDLRLGDFVLCCACGKAILLTRCYALCYVHSISIVFISFINLSVSVKETMIF